MWGGMTNYWTTSRVMRVFADRQRRRRILRRLTRINVRPVRIFGRYGYQLLLFHRGQFGECCLRVKINRLGNVDKFDHINSSFTAFHSGYERLILTERSGEIGLIHARCYSLFDQQSD